jgi:hypothetical protein
MRRNLRIGLRNRSDTPFGEFRSELRIVLNNAVVDYCNAAVKAAVRMSIYVGWAAMRCPPGMADRTDGIRQRVLCKQAAQVLQAARLLCYLQTSWTHNSDTGGIVSAVLQASEPLQDDVERTS